MLPFHHAVGDDFAAVNTLIVQKLHSDVGLVENIGHYIIEAGGKRLRPLLVLLFARCLGYNQARHIELAAVIEFIHTATLLHDDVVDMSALRRGRPTANAQWGNAPSVLVGDFLYSRAFQMLVAIGNLRIMGLLADTTNVLSEGEVQQLINAKNPQITEAQYLNVIYKKTAALFEAACMGGAVLANAPEPHITAAKTYGYHLGLAFQLVDDALDYTGDAASLGKNIGDDLAEGKATLPLIHAMTQAPAAEKTLLQDAIRQGQLDQLSTLVAIVQRTGSLDYTLNLARQHAHQAEIALNALPESPLRATLQALAQFAVTRQH